MAPLKTVWIIDDDPISRFGLKKLAGMTNFCLNIFYFENGQEALNYLKYIIDSAELLPNVILLDLNMPIIDGWQFLDAIKTLTLWEKIKICLVSSSIDRADHLKAKQYTCVSDFLVKPFNKFDLQRVFQETDSLND